MKGTVFSLSTTTKTCRLVVKSYLEQDGYRVLTAANGAETLEKGRNGPAGCRAARSWPAGRGRTVPHRRASAAAGSAGIIVVSGKAETTDRIVGLEMGADGLSDQAL